MKVIVFNDPGHAWGKVPKSKLVELGIAGQVTPYSYEHGGYAYLEEDCDLSLFLRAAKAAGIAVELEERYCNGRSAVRRMRPYSAASLA